MIPVTKPVQGAEQTREIHKQAHIGQIHIGICLDSTTDLRGTTRRLELATSVEKVDIYIEKSFRETDSKEFVLLLKTIGSLPKLISLWIRSLSLDGQFVQIPISSLETILESSKHSLKRLGLSHVDFTFPPEQMEGTCPLVALAKLMEGNKNLKDLTINYSGHRKISRSSQRALLHTLEHKNYSLEFLDFDRRTLRQFSTSKWKRIQFYLALNQGGMRQQLLDPSSTASSHEWEEAVISNRDQSSMVYYLLSNNPAMICAY